MELEFLSYYWGLCVICMDVGVDLTLCWKVRAEMVDCMNSYKLSLKCVL